LGGDKINGTNTNQITIYKSFLGSSRFQVLFHKLSKKTFFKVIMTIISQGVESLSPLRESALIGTCFHVHVGVILYTVRSEIRFHLFNLITALLIVDIMCRTIRLFFV
jgi:hypothetical protein